MRKITTLLFVCFFHIVFAQTTRQLENITAFNRLYGYVKYFHPSDEAAELDWDRFAIYGSRKVEKCKDRRSLQKALQNLFEPFAPTVQVFPSAERKAFSKAGITPPDTGGYKVVTWQHTGHGGTNPKSVYRSGRLNRARKIQVDGTTSQYPYRPAFKTFCLPGEYAHNEIGAGLSAIIPLALFGNENNTWPIGDEDKFRALQEEMKTIPVDPESELFARIGGIIIAWNVFQHFYPYFDVVDTDWPKAFHIALMEAYGNRSVDDYLKTLRRFTAQLKDGHIRINSVSARTNEVHAPPIMWEWIEQKLVITKSGDDRLKPGDVVTAVNGIPSQDYFDEIFSYISAATPGWLYFRAQTSSLLGPLNAMLTVRILDEHNKEKEVSLTRNLVLPDHQKLGEDKQDRIRELTDGVYYINIGLSPMEEIKKHFGDLQRAKAIICDLRGYPKGNHEIISHFLQQNDTSRRWMQVPRIIYPDQNNIAGFAEFGWGMTIKDPHLGAKVFFLLDGRAISYAESFMSFIEHYKLATIIGQPSAGTNGNVNRFQLPGGYDVFWTGMKVVKHDGSQLHGIGILPDVYVNKTIQGIRENRDEFLEKAVELATQYK